jgi:hypothetical protein
MFRDFSVFITMLVQEVLVLGHYPIRDEHEPQMSRRIFGTIIEEIVEVTLQMVFIQSATLNLDK